MKSHTVRLVHFGPLLIATLTGLSTFSTSEASGAAWTSAKSYNCVAILEQTMVGNYMGRSELQNRGAYTLNAIEAFGQNILGVEESEGGVPNVFAHSAKRPNVQLVNELSDRLKGIKLQAQMGVEQSLQEHHVSLAFTLTDPNEIKTFTQAVFRRSETYRNAKMQSVFTYRNILISNAIAATLIGAASGSPAIMYLGAITLSATYSLWPFGAYIDSAQFNQQEVSNSFSKVLLGELDWSVLSMTVPFERGLFLKVLSLENEGRDASIREVYAAALAIHGRQFSEMPYYRQFIEKLVPRAFAYVSTDMILDRSSGVPELHVVVRYSTKKPDFPKRRKRVKEKLILDPIIEPGMVPLPVKN